MKGTIVKCLEDMVKAGADGAESWKTILSKAGMSPKAMFTSTGVVPDGDVLKLITSAAEVLKMHLGMAMDAFGDYWSTTYAPKTYSAYFARAKSAREFLLSLDQVHVAMTKSMEGAAPPRFRYEDKGPKDLVMHYASPRGMVALMPGLIQGVARFYKEKVTVRTEGNALHIHFA
jgi:hypothetical protein